MEKQTTSSNETLVSAKVTLNNKDEKRRDFLLDIFKYLLAFMVVCIHFGYRISGFDVRPICRLAVAMFFMISGFYSYKKDKSVSLEKTAKSIRRTLKYVIIAYSIFRYFLKNSLDAIRVFRELAVIQLKHQT